MSDSTQRIICFQVNGEPFTGVEGMTIVELIRELKLADKKVAVELNEEIVPSSRHMAMTLTEGDVVEVVTAIGGG